MNDLKLNAEFFCYKGEDVNFNTDNLVAFKAFKGGEVGGRCYGKLACFLNVGKCLALGFSASGEDKTI